MHGVDLRSLSYDRFLSVVYFALLKRLDYNPAKPDSLEKARHELDRSLQVGEWRTPGSTSRARARVGDATPHWWRGDEDASQGFLAAMGVTA